MPNSGARFAEYTDFGALIQDIRTGLLAYADTGGAIKTKHEGDPLFLGKKYTALTVSFDGFSYAPRTSERSKMPGVINFKVRFKDVALLTSGVTPDGTPIIKGDRRLEAEKRCAAAAAEWWEGWTENPRLDNRATEVRLNAGDAGDQDAFGNARLDDMSNFVYVLEIDVQILI